MEKSSNYQLFKILENKLNIFSPLNYEDEEDIANLISAKKIIQPEQSLVDQEEKNQIIYILEDGWCYEYQMLKDGKRQIIDFVLPGSFIGLKTSLFGIKGYSVSTLNQCLVNVVYLNDLLDLIEKKPKTMELISWIFARRTAMLSEHIVSLGRRNSYDRVAHLFYELYKRLKLLGLTKEGSFELPATQEMLADFLGITVVHVNRILKRMAGEEIIAYNNHKISLLNLEKLKSISGHKLNCLDKSTLPAQSKELFY